MRQRREFHQRQPPGERFRHLPHQRWRHGSQQQEPAVAAALRIDGAAQPGEHVRPSLSFVQHHQIASRKTRLPLQIEAQALRRLLQIVVSATQGAGQRRLAALPRPHQRDSGKGRKAALQHRRDFSRQHAPPLQRHAMQNRNQFLFCTKIGPRFLSRDTALRAHRTTAPRGVPFRTGQPRLLR